MSFFKKKKGTELRAYAQGKIIALSDVNDPMFSQGLMGPGIAIDSVDGKYYSPVDGKITMLFPTYHALGIETEAGEQLLLHIGVDTVNLKGQGFQAYVQNGQMVSTGDLLLEVDLDLIREHGYSTEAILCVTEPQGVQLTLNAKKEVIVKEDIIGSITK